MFDKFVGVLIGEIQKVQAKCQLAAPWNAGAAAPAGSSTQKAVTEPPPLPPAAQQPNKKHKGEAADMVVDTVECPPGMQ